MMKSSLTGRVKDNVAELPRAPQRERWLFVSKPAFGKLYRK